MQDIQITTMAKTENSQTGSEQQNGLRLRYEFYPRMTRLFPSKACCLMYLNLIILMMEVSAIAMLAINWPAVKIMNKTVPQLKIF